MALGSGGYRKKAQRRIALGHDVSPYVVNRTRRRSQSASRASSTSRAATASMVCTASSTSGGSGSQCPPLRSMNRIRHAHAARLLPSGGGWFHASRHVRTAALSYGSG